MESAKYSIDNDNDFYLTKLPVLNGLLDWGITLFVDKDFPPYHDMTLVQYAIAKRKPKCLKALLDILKGNLKKNSKEIMFPTSSNTRANLLKLAIEFGSKSKYYDTEDDKCLEIIINAFGEASDNKDNNNDNNNDDNLPFDVDLGNKTSETPLITAIRNRNTKAIDLLMGRKANIFHPLKENEEIIQSSQVSSMPIMIIFKLHNNQDELKDIFDNVLKDYSGYIFTRLNKLKVKDGDSQEEFIGVLEKYRLHNSNEFLIERIKQNTKKISTLDQNKGQADTQDNEQPNANPSQEEICSAENCTRHAITHCNICGRPLCDEHSPIHHCS